MLELTEVPSLLFFLIAYFISIDLLPHSDFFMIFQVFIFISKFFFRIQHQMSKFQTCLIQTVLKILLFIQIRWVIELDHNMRDINLGLWVPKSWTVFQPMKALNTILVSQIYSSFWLQVIFFFMIFEKCTQSISKITFVFKYCVYEK